MKHLITSNNELLEVLVENGINIICDDQMRMTISDEDAEILDKVVEEFAPAAACDYTVTDIVRFVVKWAENEASLAPKMKTANNAEIVKCNSIEDAHEVYNNELAETSLTKIADLDFEPSEKECRQHLTQLEILQFSEGGDFEYIESSDSYWVEEI